MLLEVEHLRVAFRMEGKLSVPVRDVSFTVPENGRVALVGESGCGKSLTSLAVGGLVDRAEIMGKISGSPHIAYIFQNPMQSLNPVMRVGKQIAEGLRASKKAAAPRGRAEEERVASLLESVGLPRATIRKFPCELSGGQQQRVMIAMALAQDPDLLIADEPTTALDVTIQAQILRLMNDLKHQFGTSILFITHDLGVINQMADDVAVMYCGQIVEMSPVRNIFAGSDFMHPYTEGLLRSIPRLDAPSDERLESIPGAVPHPLNLPKGCKFAPRCKYCTERCLQEEPALVAVSDEQQIRCFYPDRRERHATR